MMRVPAEVTSREVAAIPSLKSLIAYWESEAANNPKSPRYDFLNKFLGELKDLGYQP